MGYDFAQLKGAIDALNLASVALGAAGLSAVGAIHLERLIAGDVVGPGRLNHPAKLLSDLVRGNLDLVVVRCPGALFGGLDLRGDLGGLLQQIGKFLIQKSLLRVHANLRES